MLQSRALPGSALRPAVALAEFRVGPTRLLYRIALPGPARAWALSILTGRSPSSSLHSPFLAVSPVITG